MTTYTRRSILYWLVLAPLVLVILFPYAVTLSTALKPKAEILTFPPSWVGSELRWLNFVEMWSAVGFGQALLASVVVSTLATVACLLVAIPAAYALARLRFRGQGVYRQVLLVTQMLSPIVLVIGIFAVVHHFTDYDALGAAARLAWNLVALTVNTASRFLGEIAAVLGRAIGMRRLSRMASAMGTVGLSYAGAVILRDKDVRRAQGWRHKFRAAITMGAT